MPKKHIGLDNQDQGWDILRVGQIQRGITLFDSTGRGS